MKQALVLLLFGCMACAQTNNPMDKDIKLDTEAKKASYGLGVVLANNIKSQNPDSIDMEALFKGFYDKYKGSATLMNDQECMQAVQKSMSAAAERKNAGAKKAGEDFLAQNKSKTGVTTTTSGLQYKVLKAGTGKMPSASSQVTVHYTGKLIDGTVFDSSVERNEPATFPVNGVIQGWVEALQLMKEGDKWELYIPSQLGYGERGAGQQIPPFSTLIFEVELIKVN
ncbi:MAG: FKBP-type peptidyl-prolyl cis-trans isomerase [Bacteroidetes bacterium]|nr:FKBP-type peptidyl-prolyl cis-trans isomerase [Bacteroidota bacterium]